MPVTVTRLSEVCGAEIFGVDLRRPLAADDVAAIYRAWLDHQVIVFRGQDLSPADQKRACSHFGEIGAYNRPKSRQHPEHASDEIMLISNVRDQAGRVIGAHPDGEMMWHTDTMYVPSPHKATTLFAVEVPSEGGNTKFSNQYKVYDALPGALKQKLQGAMAMHCYEFGTTVKTFARYDRMSVPHHAHPVLRKHPETGRIAVYVCPLMTEEIIGMDEAESAAILAEIFEFQGRESFVYEHVWRVGDLVMWDNRCLLHARTDFPPDQRRLLRRVTINDESEVLAA